jgi:hypothetical protein
MKIIEMDGQNFLLVEFEETETTIIANAKDILLLHVEQKKRTNPLSNQVEIIPEISMLNMAQNMFGITRSTFPKNKVIIHDVHPESSLVKEVNRQRSPIQIIEAPSTGNRSLDRKILTGDTTGVKK